MLGLGTPCELAPNVNLTSFVIPCGMFLDIIGFNQRHLLSDFHPNLKQP